MKLLAIETATEACSAALYIDGEVREEFRIAPREHAKLVLGMAEQLLSDSGLKLGDMDALAFGRGPGAFTGVRIATSVIQGMAFAADLPVVPVSTLACLAQGGYREFGWQKVAAAIDARMNEVYWGAYEIENGIAVERQAERVSPAEAVPRLPDREWCGIGSGWLTFEEALVERQGDALMLHRGDFYPHAQDVATLAVAAYDKGEAVSADRALPIYLRDQVVHKAAK